MGDDTKVNAEPVQKRYYRRSSSKSGPREEVLNSDEISSPSDLPATEASSYSNGAVGYYNSAFKIDEDDSESANYVLPFEKSEDPSRKTNSHQTTVIIHKEDVDTSGYPGLNQNELESPSYSQSQPSYLNLISDPIGYPYPVTLSAPEQNPDLEVQDFHNYEDSRSFNVEQDFNQEDLPYTSSDPIQDSTAKGETWWRTRKCKWVTLGMIVFLVVATAVIVPTLLITLKDKVLVLPEGKNSWISCPSNSNRGNREEKECIDGGCIWKPSADPWPSCYLSEESSSGYSVVQSFRSDEDSPLVVQLRRNSKINLFGKPYESVWVDVDDSHANRVTVRISPDDGNGTRNGTGSGTSAKVSSLAYKVEISSNEGDEFSLKILRRADDQVIWDSSFGGMVLEEGFLQVSSRLPSSYLYGMGQNGHGPGLRRDFDRKTWPLFNRDPSTQGKEKLNLNSFHPFYLTLENNGSASGVLFRTLQASEYILLPVPAIVFRTIDTYLEFVVFIGDNPMHVNQLLSEVIGRASLPPSWALGHHFYPSGNPEDSIALIRMNEISLDAVHLSPSLWTQEMVMDPKTIKYNKLTDYIQDNQNLSWIIPLSPAILAKTDYLPFELLEDNLGLVSWSPEVPIGDGDYPPDYSNNNSLIFGTKSSPGAVDYVTFMDFEHPRADIFLQAMLGFLKTECPFRGIHTVANVPTNVDTNRDKCSIPGPDTCWTLKCPDSQWDQPPYVTAAVWGHEGSSKLSDGTVCMSGQHWVGNKRKRPHLKVHNYFGMRVAQISLASCIPDMNDKNRCLVMSESTAYSLDPDGPPTGSVVKFLDPVDSTWEAIKRTMHDIMEFNLLGIPLVGADICGSSTQPEERLCLRWTQLGAFYPVFRVRQDSNLLASPSLVQALKTSIQFKYSYLDYTYSALFMSQKLGDPLITPLFYHFPADEDSRNVETQFMYGHAFMVCPILDKRIDQASHMEVYFPEGEWYRAKGNAILKVVLPGGHGMARVDDLRETPVFVRAGQIIPYHNPQDNVGETLNSSLILRVFPKSGKSKGFLYVDDGTKKDSFQSKNYYYFEFEQNQCEMSINRIQSPKDGEVRQPILLQEIVIYNWERSSQLLVNSYMAGTCKYQLNHRILTCTADIDLKNDQLNSWVINWEAQPGACIWP